MDHPTTKNSSPFGWHKNVDLRTEFQMAQLRWNVGLNDERDFRIIEKIINLNDFMQVTFPFQRKISLSKNERPVKQKEMKRWTRKERIGHGLYFSLMKTEKVQQERKSRKSKPCPANFLQRVFFLRKFAERYGRFFFGGTFKEIRRFPKELNRETYRGQKKLWAPNRLFPIQFLAF